MEHNTSEQNFKLTQMYVGKLDRKVLTAKI